MGVLVRYLQSCFWATSAEQRICRLTNCTVTVLGRYSMCLLLYCPWAWIFVFVPTLLTYLGRTANPGRDDVFAVIIHAWAWDGTRFLKLVWLPLIPSLLNIWLIVAWKSGVLGLRFFVLPRDKFGKGIPFESFCEFPSNVLRPAHCITWCGKRACSSWIHVHMTGCKPCFSLPHPQHLSFF